jgi:hypothetical protein
MGQGLAAAPVALFSAGEATWPAGWGLTPVRRISRPARATVCLAGGRQLMQGSLASGSRVATP